MAGNLTDHGTDASSVASTWTVHPARERPGRAVAAGVVIIAATVLVYLMMHSAAWAAAFAVALLLSVNRFYFPSRYRIDAEGITAYYPFSRKSLRWEQVRRVQVDQVGVLLSPHARATRLDRRDGLSLDFGRHRDEVLARLRAALPEGVAWYGVSATG